MAENQILPFAQGTSANVQTQTAYAGDVQRLSGNQPGIARSAFVNKTLRQCAAMSAGLGQYIADRQSSNVTDAMTPTQVAAALANSVGATIPAASQTVAGKIMTATAAQAQELTDNTRAITPTMLAVAFTNNSSPNVNGYQKMPGGIILQWGVVARAPEQSSIIVTYPIAFPRAAWHVGITSGSVTGAGTPPIVCSLSSIIATSFTGEFKRGTGEAVEITLNLRWFAIGY